MEKEKEENIEKKMKENENNQKEEIKECKFKDGSEKNIGRCMCGEENKRKEVCENLYCTSTRIIPCHKFMDSKSPDGGESSANNNGNSKKIDKSSSNSSGGKTNGNSDEVVAQQENLKQPKQGEDLGAPDALSLQRGMSNFHEPNSLLEIHEYIRNQANVIQRKEPVKKGLGSLTKIITGELIHVLTSLFTKRINSKQVLLVVFDLLKTAIEN